MPKNKKKLLDLVVSKPENRNLTRKIAIKTQIDFNRKKRKQGILSLLTLSYKLTKLREK